MYLMIHESGDMLLLAELTKDDLAAADNGMVGLLDVSRADKPLRYFDEGWTDVDVPNAGNEGPRAFARSARMICWALARRGLKWKVKI